METRAVFYKPRPFGLPLMVITTPVWSGLFCGLVASSLGLLWFGETDTATVLLLPTAFLGMVFGALPIWGVWLVCHLLHRRGKISMGLAGLLSAAGLTAFVMGVSMSPALLPSPFGYVLLFSAAVTGLVTGVLISHGGYNRTRTPAA